MSPGGVTKTRGKEDSAVEPVIPPDASADLFLLLVHPQPDGAPSRFSIGDEGMLRVGRAGDPKDKTHSELPPSAQILLDDGGISKQHFELELSGEALLLRDLDSSNGTLLNGRPVSPGMSAIAADGDVIRAGDSIFMIRRASASAPSKDADELGDRFLPGCAPAMVEARDRLRRLADNESPVLILGETGTGKEFAARALHHLRGFAEEQFIPLNCGQLKRELAGGELFGTERGTYTGAEDREGLVWRAESGTLFLDEIGELALDVQSELLRFLQDGKYRRLGGTELRTSTARIVAATLVDLDEAVQKGKFRQDLLARLRRQHYPVRLPPLKDRREDLVDWFLRFMPHPAALSAGAVESLLLYHWPDNLRELEKAARAASEAAGDEPTIEANHLPGEVSAVRRARRKENPPAVPLTATAAAEAKLAPRDISREDLAAALGECEGKVLRVARKFGISARSVRRQLEKHGLSAQAFRREG